VQVAIVGGGLAGLAAAVALSGRGLQVELFEAKRRLGGRAGSYLDRESGELVDHCQHVAMGCCTNYLDFCRRTGIAELFERHKTLHFFGPDDVRSDFRSSRWLPAPLHLAPALLGLKHLSVGEKWAIACAILRLVRTPPTDSADSPTVLAWLQEQRHPPRAIERFWQVVLVSALGESLDRASLAAARKVLLDGFVSHAGAADVYIPTTSLARLYDRVAEHLQARGVTLHLETPVRHVHEGSIQLVEGTSRSCQFVILAADWRRAGGMLSPALHSRLPQVASAGDFGSAPITGVHLWLDRPITDLPHAVLVGRLSQWVFARDRRRTDLQSVPAGRITSPSHEYYYQVVISASHDLAGRARQDIIDEVLADLRAVFPAATGAQLLRWQLITEHDAVFSVRPGLDELRPPQQTPIPGLILAGDWTATGWPATMEGAIRSGYLAAEAVLAQLGRPERLLVADLPHGWLVRMLGVRG
jgi:squalene-associated FAD-dependent desaturase